VGQPVIITSTDGPLLFQDANTTGATSTINVTTTGTVRKVVLSIGNIAHPFDADLDVTLISPMNTSLDITSDNGSSGDHYLSTLFDDAASTAITAGSSPFRGRFRPEAALSGVNGQAAAGNWGLKVVDDLGGDTGIVGFWTIGMCVE
jgi:subtilisin-like proprotein convertase family protein